MELRRRVFGTGQRGSKLLLLRNFFVNIVVYSDMGRVAVLFVTGLCSYTGV